MFEEYETAKPVELWSKEAEQQLIGAILQDHRLFDDLPEELSEKDFSPKHSRIFEAIAAIQSSGDSADVMTVAEYLSTHHDDDQMQYLSDLAINSFGTQVKAYAQMVITKTVDRNLSGLSFRLNVMAYDKTLTSDQKLAEAARQVADIDNHQTSKTQDMNSLIKSAVGELDLKFRKAKPMGLKTGFYDLDHKLEGIQRGDFIVAAARPSMGKTILAMNIARNVIIDGGNVLVFSLEMTGLAVMNRMLSDVSSINSRKIRSGQLEEHEWPALEVGARKLKDKNLTIIDTPALHINQAATIARRCNRAKKLDLIAFDYLQLLRGDTKEGRTNEISYISRMLKAIAKDCDVPVLALSQLSRKCEERGDKRPINSDLRESGQIEQDADVIMFIYRDEVYNEKSNMKGVAEINVTKNREGETGRIYLGTMFEFSRFENLSNYKPEQVESSGFRYGN